MRSLGARGKKRDGFRHGRGQPGQAALLLGLAALSAAGLPGAGPARAGDPAGAAAAASPAPAGGSASAAGAPPAFAVMRFDNRTGLPGLDWLEAAVPFLLGERIAYHLRARPAHDAWVLPRGVPPPAGAAAIAAYAREVGATWVWSGWIGGEGRAALELGVQLWRVDLEAAPAAALAGEAVAEAPQEEVVRLTGEAIAALAGHIDPAAAEEALRATFVEPPTGDFYAFTLFGRGLAEIARASGSPGQVRWRMVRARRHLDRAVLVDPRMPEAQRMLGEVHRALGGLDQARGHLAAALRLRPDYVPALLSRAALARRDRELHRAVDLYRRVLSARPWDVGHRHELGSILWESGRIDEALGELTQVVERAPDHLPARRLLVRIHARRSDREALLGALETLLRLDPGDIEARFDLAAVYLVAGRTDDAAAVYQAVAESPGGRAADRARAYKLLGDLARRGGRAEEAAAYYGQAMAAAPADPRPYFLLAAMHLERGEDAAAEKLLRQTMQFPEHVADAHAGLGAIAYRRGDLQEALWYLRRASWNRPRSASYRYDLALVLSALGRVQDALYEIRVGLRHDPEHVGLHYLHGVAMLRLGKRDRARNWFESALRLDPGHGDARHNLEQLVTRAGESPMSDQQGE